MARFAPKAIMSSFIILAMTGAALAVTGEFNGMCTQGLAMRKQVQSDCSVNATYNGKTYCFGDQKAEVMFFQDPDNNLAKAEAYWKEIHK